VRRRAQPRLRLSEHRALRDLLMAGVPAGMFRRRHERVHVPVLAGVPHVLMRQCRVHVPMGHPPSTAHVPICGLSRHLPKTGPKQPRARVEMAMSVVACRTFVRSTDP